MAINRRELVDNLLTKQASRGQEKRAFLSNLLKPLNKGLAGEALISRIAPIGNRRIMADAGHNILDMGIGAGLGAGIGKLTGASADELTALMLGGGGLSGIGSGFLNQPRANKYLTEALSGANKLSKSQLKSLLGEMNPIATGVGSGGSLVEMFQGNTARSRLRKAIENMA